MVHFHNFWKLIKKVYQTNDSFSTFFFWVHDYMQIKYILRKFVLIIRALQLYN